MFLDTDISLASHIELSDFATTHDIKLENISSIPGNNEIVASVKNRNRLLNSFFFQWRNFVKQQKANNMKKISYKKFATKKQITYYFKVWKGKFSIFQKLHMLGDSLYVVKHFSLWKRLIEQQFDERKRFMKFLLVRRSLYEKKFFSEWKRSLSLVKRYKAVGKKDDQSIQYKVIRAFRINIQKKKQIQNFQLIVQDNNLKFLQIAFFRRWRKQLKTIRLGYFMSKKHFSRMKGVYFDKWILQKRKRDRISRQIKAIVILHNKLVKRKYFEILFRKYIKKDEARNKLEMINRMKRKIVFEKFFSKWLSRFNSNNYLSSSEQALREFLYLIRVRRYFVRWHSYYNRIQNRNIKIESSLKKFQYKKLAKLFMKWRSRYAFHNFEIVMLKKAHRRLGKLYKKNTWRKWVISLRKHLEEREMNQSATKFRNISLQLKAFNRIKIFWNKQKYKESKRYKAQAQYILHLERAALISWKLMHIKTKRRFFMITSVLKSWAYNVQKKSFLQWLKYVRHKKQEKIDILNAVDTYKRRSVSLAITCFVMATKSLKESYSSFDGNSESSDIDLLKSDEDLSLNMSKSFEITKFEKNTSKCSEDNNDIMNKSKMIQTNSFIKSQSSNIENNDENYRYIPTKLPPPQRPSFLGPGYSAYPMQHTISMVNAPMNLKKTKDQLKEQIEELISKLQNCDEKEKPELNLQLKSCIDQVNELISQLP